MLAAASILAVCRFGRLPGGKSARSPLIDGILNLNVTALAPV
jgi:hypothetical protein